MRFACYVRASYQTITNDTNLMEIPFKTKMNRDENRTKKIKYRKITIACFIVTLVT